ncbi:MAG: MOSC domain-containing protein [Bacteroidota bacterium]|nr:MOSC domain-containing protein [Bacteroidota bacterium]
MLQISDLFIYPVKSLGGISVEKAEISSMGLLHDRRWMLVDRSNRFLTQREIPAMCLLQVDLLDDGLRVHHRHHPEKWIQVAYVPEGQTLQEVKLFEDYCQALPVSKRADRWFTEMLGVTCQLMYIPEDSVRKVDPDYAPVGTRTGFADAFPFLLIGRSSMDDLNHRLTEKMSILRFRPNIVFEGGDPFLEDRMDHLQINEVNFFAVKPCARCTVPTINPENASRTDEPIKTLSDYRKKNHKVYFGQNMISEGNGRIHVGNPLKIVKYKNPIAF